MERGCIRRMANGMGWIGILGIAATLAVLLFLPVVSSEAKSATYKVTTKEIKSGEKTIYGRIYRPSKKGKLPVVIYAHGLGGSLESGEAYAEYFAKKGMAVYAFDFCGGGNGSRSTGKTTQMSVLTEVADLELVLEEVRGWDFVDKKKVTLLGASQGGMVSAITAARHKNQVNGLILMYPAFVAHDEVRGMFGSLSDVPKQYNFKGWITLGKKYAADIWDYDVYSEIGNFKKKVLLLHGDEDDIVPLSYSDKAAKTYSKVTYKILKGAGHGFWGEEEKQAKKYMNSYLKKQKLY